MQKTNGRILTGFLIFAVVVFTGCNDNETAGPGAPAIPPEALAASETVDVAGLQLSLETYLWRDFMPISPPDGKPMIALVSAVEADQNEIPPELDIDHLWVIYDDSVWATGTFDDDPPPHPPYKIQRVARDGPKWGPGIQVDVVVRLVGTDGTPIYLKAGRQAVHRTE